MGTHSAMASKPRSLCTRATPARAAIAAIRQSFGRRTVRPERPHLTVDRSGGPIVQPGVHPHQRQALGEHREALEGPGSGAPARISITIGSLVATSAPPASHSRSSPRARALAAADGPVGLRPAQPWLLWFDAEGRQLPVVVPVDDIPETPTRLLANLMHIADEIAAQGGDDATAAMTLSRPGSARVQDGDRAWARALHRQGALAGVRLWPVHLATTGSVRPLTLDDVGWTHPHTA